MFSISIPVELRLRWLGRFLPGPFCFEPRRFGSDFWTNTRRRCRGWAFYRQGRRLQGYLFTVWSIRRL